MNKEELYELALSDVHKYNLLNEIFAIREETVENIDYTIGINGFISLDVLNDYVDRIQRTDKAIEYINTNGRYDYDMEPIVNSDGVLSILKGENNE